MSNSDGIEPETHEAILRAQIEAKHAELRDLEQQLAALRRERAPRCETCGVALWNDRMRRPQFVAVQTDDTKLHDFCEKDASAFIARNGYASKGGTVTGAWDVPDPMGL